ncbi:hypothetical protein C2142_37615 [Streptomyces sp. CB01881]|nr:hypothetical protein C2142_37615 [Streptomyces sp. CB01881]
MLSERHRFEQVLRVLFARRMTWVPQPRQETISRWLGRTSRLDGAAASRSLRRRQRVEHHHGGEEDGFPFPGRRPQYSQAGCVSDHGGVRSRVSWRARRLRPVAAMSRGQLMVPR